jgi:two-component system chemotaxis sensor kinase CheA
MDVVKTTVEAMRGRIALRSRPGRGTTLTITLPLTLAFIDAMVVRDGARLFALPTERVIEVLQKTPERMASTAHGEHALVRVRERHVPLLSLPRFYGEPGGALDVEEGRLLVVVQGRAGSVAIPVDAVLGHQQIMLKPLGGLMQKIRGATGYGMLRTGDVALTLDCEQLTT